MAARRLRHGSMIVLVRHGETEGNARRVMQLPDTPLSSVGLAQAERLAERLAGMGIAHILCSDLLRARMTALPIARRTGTQVEFSPLLQERNFGDLRGTPYAELPCADPFAPDYVPPGGESWQAFFARAAQAFALVVARRRALAGNLAVVTHGLMCRALVERHARCADVDTLPARFDNTSVSLIEPEPPHSVSLVNCCAHLREDEVARAKRGAPV
jgi:probable phosphoglycerate mutase